MSHKNTQTWNRIRRLCQIQDLDEKELYARSRRLLSLYREVCWSACGRAGEVREKLDLCCGSQLDDALIYLEVFAPEAERERFEERVTSLYETRCLTELVERAMDHLREYPGQGELYGRILSKCYLERVKYRETELLEILHMERSSFYDRKREAILLFGVSLWGYSVPDFRRTLEAAKS